MHLWTKKSPLTLEVIQMWSLDLDSGMDMEGEEEGRGKGEEEGKGEGGGKARGGREKEGTPTGWFTPLHVRNPEKYPALDDGFGPDLPRWRSACYCCCDRYCMTGWMCGGRVRQPMCAVLSTAKHTRRLENISVSNHCLTSWPPWPRKQPTAAPTVNVTVESLSSDCVCVSVAVALRCCSC